MGRRGKRSLVLSLLGVLLLRLDSGSEYFRSEKISKFTSDYESQVCGKEEVSSEWV